jgi:hypothetical protein
MKAVLIALMLLAAPLAHAADCAGPTYGDTAENVVRLNEIFSGPGQWGEVMPLLTMVCKSKFEGATRAPLYSVGLTDKDIDAYGTARITLIWLTATLQRQTELRLPQ